MWNWTRHYLPGSNQILALPSQASPAQSSHLSEEQCLLPSPQSCSHTDFPLSSLLPTSNLHIQNIAEYPAYNHFASFHPTTTHQTITTDRAGLLQKLPEWSSGCCSCPHALSSSHPLGPRRRLLISLRTKPAHVSGLLLALAHCPCWFLPPIPPPHPSLSCRHCSHTGY